jgi:hypothetical protein
MATTVPHPIVKPPRLCQRNVMNNSLPLELVPEDKLDALRYLDEFRFWYSLDDQRRCQRCHRVLTGNQIEVLELHGTRGRMQLRCPTVGCDSTSSEWIYVDPIHAASQKTPSAGLQRLKLNAVARGKKIGKKRTRSQVAPRRFAALRAALLQRSKSALLSTIPPAPDPTGP